MPQQSRMMYQLDTRTEAERDADIKDWVKAHSTDYRKQKQAASGRPPEDPSGGHGTGDYRGGDKPSTTPVWAWLLTGVLSTATGFIVGYLIFTNLL